MRVFAGTSGYAYPEWKGTFYPADLPAAGFLPHYAARLPAVEINNTFYRMPKRHVVAGWAAEVPDGFRFVLKASRRITHFARLSGCEQAVEYLAQAVRGLGDRAGPTLFQLPPNLPADVPRLEAFLALLPPDLRAAFEFRHKSWYSDEVHALLRAHDAALVTSDGEGQSPDALVTTATWGYLRLRRADYDDAAIRTWAQRLSAAPWEEAWVFLKHEDGGEAPRQARLLLDALG